MANYDLTDKEKAVYHAIATLRAKGQTNLTVVEVAKMSGVGRSTINQSTLRWQTVRETIKGAHSPHVNYLENELSVVSTSTNKLYEFDARVKNAEESLEFMQNKAKLIHSKLLDQLQYYFSLAGETPSKTKKNASVLKELAAVKQENNRLKSDLSQYQATLSPDTNITPIVNKKIITLPDYVGLTDASIFIKELETLLSNYTNKNNIKAVFLLMGLPLSGKSDWIHKHMFHTAGITVFIDSINHLRETRDFILTQTKSRISVPIHCVRIRTPIETCKHRGERIFNGVEHVQFQRRLDKAFIELEEVSLNESFDSIILA